MKSLKQSLIDMDLKSLVAAGNGTPIQSECREYANIMKNIGSNKRQAILPDLVSRAEYLSSRIALYDITGTVF